MNRVVLVHGIGQQVKGPQTLLEEWFPALSDGIFLAGSRLDKDEVSAAFYGDIFRPSGVRSLADPPLDSSDVTDPIEKEWLHRWWEESARQDPTVIGPTDKGRIRTPYQVQRALDALSHSAFFSGLSEHMMISSLRQVRRYFTESQTRHKVRNRVADCIDSDTRVVIGHSLGSVIAYEALCASTENSRIDFVTLRDYSFIAFSDFSAPKLWRSA